MQTLCLLIFVSTVGGILSQTAPPSKKSPHPYNFATSNQRSRRLQGPIEHKRVSFPQYSGSRTPPNSRKHQNKKNGVPPYAVQMEPLVQYSQPDPLYTIEKQYISEAKPSEPTTNDLIRKAIPNAVVADIAEAESISRAGKIQQRPRISTYLSPPPARRPGKNRHHQNNVEFSSYGTYYEGPPEAFEPPEPIIEIIIKESNESLPAPPPLPTPPPPKKVKEPVQVFYVKYRKDPAGGYGGEDKVIYDPPVPAVTPPANNEDDSPPEEVPEPVAPEYGVPEEEEATAPPPPSTTLKAIIHPDSEKFHASGVHITFGGPPEEEGESQDQAPPYGQENPHGELEQQSAPQPAIAFPNYTPKPFISRSSSGATSSLTKRNPGPFNGQPQFQQNFPQPAAPPTFQQTPQFSSQNFQTPRLNPNQYSTIPQNYQFPRQPSPQPPQAQPQPQRYSTINNPPPVQPQYQTINQPQPNFQPFGQPPSPPRLSSQEQHQQQVEQVNRLQQQQQLLQQQISQQHRFQPFPQQVQPQKQQQQFVQQPVQQFSQQQSQPTFIQQSSISQYTPQPAQTQFSQLPSQQFQQQPSFQQPQQIRQQPQPVQQQQQQQQQYRQPPQLQYSSLDTSNIQNHRQEVTTTARPTRRPQVSRTTAFESYRTTTSRTTTEEVTEIVTEDPKKAAKDKKRKEEQVKKNIANLPDEVPADLREQLLSSGILGNADIQILDYDKIGDIPIESLPPEALANFQQAAGSRRVHVVARPDPIEDEDSATSSSEQRSVVIKGSQDGDMEMKVVRYDPNEGRGVADRYMKQGATQLAPVVLNDSKYNRYLPLQVSGAQFPVPDVAELRGRNVTSVVVLAPVDYEFLNRRDEASEGRVGRSAAPVLEVQGVHFVAGDVLKTLVRMPSKENYRRWLQKENSTSADKQSVVLLVVEPGSGHPDKEIFMYDIASGRVSKLRGELSSTFVQVAESNSHNQDLEEISDTVVAPGGDFSTSRLSSTSS